MAVAADTIVVLDGIQFQKVTSSDVYTQNHETNEAVVTRGIHIPLNYKAARVIFNGAYDPNGGRFHIRAKGTRTTSLAGRAVKTANQQLLEWTALTPPAVAKSAVFDVRDSWDSMIHIDIAQSSGTANTTGIEIIVQGRKEDGLDEWTEIVRFLALALGAATKSDFAATEAEGQTVLSVTDPTTGNLDHVGKNIFLEDTATIAQCEIAFITECGADS